MTLALSCLGVVLLYLITTTCGQGTVTEFAERCEKETHVPQSDIDNYKDMKLPQTREGKCYGACVMKAAGLMSSRGKMNEKKVEDLVRGYSEKTTRGSAVSSVQACTRRANRGNDACRTADSFNRCLLGARSSVGKSSGAEWRHGASLTVTIPLEISLTPPPLSFTLLSLSLLG